MCDQHGEGGALGRKAAAAGLAARRSGASSPGWRCSELAAGALPRLEQPVPPSAEAKEADKAVPGTKRVAEAAVRGSGMCCFHAEPAPEERCAATKGRSCESSARSPSRCSGGASKKKKPEDQTSLISCHPQRGVLHPQPAAADETAQAAGPAARAARGHRAAAPHRCKPFNGRQPRRSCDRGLGS